MMATAKAIGVVLIIALASLSVLAQTPQPAASTENSPAATGMITGRVVDENDQPVPRAVVRVQPFRGSGGKTVIANRDGEFQIKGLEPVDYGLFASLPSYADGRSEHLRPNGAFRIGDRATLKLIRGGVVTGKVTDANGRPVVGVGVRAIMVRDELGRPLTHGFTRYRATDDRGVYRLYGLWGGTYIVVAGGPDTNPSRDQTTYESDAPTYAHSATRATAAEIGVRAGEEVSDVDIRYRGEQGRVISGDVKLPSGLQAGYSVMLYSGGDAQAPLWSTSTHSSGRGFVFQGIDDGEYHVIAKSADSSGELAVSELKPVSVRGADVTGLQLTAKLLGSVSGRVVLEDPKFAECNDKENPLAMEAFVFASPNENETVKRMPQSLEDYWSMGTPGRPDSDGNFRLQNMIPGQYYFGLRFMARRWYVNSIAFVPGAPARPVDAARVWTNVKESERLANLNITLVHGGATLRGGLTLAEGEQVPPQLFMYLIPAEREKANDVLRFFATQVQSNGYIGLENIAPGRYWFLIKPAEGSATAPLTKLRSPQETETRKRLRSEAEAAKNEIELKPCQTIDNFRPSLRPATQN